MSLSQNVAPISFPFAGSGALPDSAQTLTAAQLGRVLTIAPTAARAVTLPDASALSDGIQTTVVSTGAFAVTLDVDGGGTINGAASVATSGAGEAITVLTSGGNYVTA